MSLPVDPIPSDTTIVDKLGRITDFFRLRWEQVIALGTTIPSFTTPVSNLGKTAAIATTTIVTVVQAGLYRLVLCPLKTIPDGVASSVTVTVRFTSRGIACSHAFAALTTDTVGANDTNLWEFYADGSSDIQYETAYSSTTPNTMTYDITGSLERLL